MYTKTVHTIMSSCLTVKNHLEGSDLHKSGVKIQSGDSAFLVLGDPHIRFKNLDRIHDVRLEIEQWVQSLLPQQLDAIVILGDVLHDHERVHVQLMNQAVDWIVQLSQLPTKKGVYLLVGNHDYINNSQFLSDQHWMHALKHHNRVYVIDRVFVDEESGMVALPYVPNGQLHRALETCPAWQEKHNAFNVVFAHQEIRGCVINGQPNNHKDTTVDSWPTEYPVLISGHIHDRQLVNGNVYYPGSLMTHRQGESNQKMATLVHVDRSHTRSSSTLVCAVPLVVTTNTTHETFVFDAKQFNELADQLEHETLNGKEQITEWIQHHVIQHSNFVRCILQVTPSDMITIKSRMLYKHLAKWDSTNLQVVFRLTPNSSQQPASQPKLSIFSHNVESFEIMLKRVIEKEVERQDLRQSLLSILNETTTQPPTPAASVAT